MLIRIMIRTEGWTAVGFYVSTVMMTVSPVTDSTDRHEALPGVSFLSSAIGC